MRVSRPSCCRRQCFRSSPCQGLASSCSPQLVPPGVVSWASRWGARRSSPPQVAYHRKIAHPSSVQRGERHLSLLAWDRIGSRIEAVHSTKPATCAGYRSGQHRSRSCLPRGLGSWTSSPHLPAASISTPPCSLTESRSAVACRMKPSDTISAASTEESYDFCFHLAARPPHVHDRADIHLLHVARQAVQTVSCWLRPHFGASRVFDHPCKTYLWGRVRTWKSIGGVWVPYTILRSSKIN